MSAEVDLAASLFDRHPADLHRFASGNRQHVLLVERSEIYDLDDDFAVRLDAHRALGLTGAHRRVRIDDAPVNPRIYSISLNVAQSCNMSCSYCYADEGRFGTAPRVMSIATARSVIDALIAQSVPGTRLVVGFMGGEPMLNRALVHEATIYASNEAARAGHPISFSITTNATLLTPADARLFHDHPFAVSVSVDGDRAEHERHRRLRNGRSSYALLVEGLGLLTMRGRPTLLSARATVAAGDTNLLERLEHLLALGFDEVGFSPVRVSPTSELENSEFSTEQFTQRMIECAQGVRERLLRGQNCALSNFLTALHQIHFGTHRPYPCGGGASYVSASASGDYYTCHRLINDGAHALGSVHSGIDTGRQHRHLDQKHVDRQTPCSACWARYLCGGGCYHEVERRGRDGCNAIRRWLNFCLESYAELSTRRPELFTTAPGRNHP